MNKRNITTKTGAFLSILNAFECVNENIASLTKKRGS